MQQLDTKEQFIWLKDFYAPLLTARQQETLNLYLDGDYTLSEIAESCGSTRQAIYDMVRRTEKLLTGYEEKLGLWQRFRTARRKAEQAEALVERLNCDEKAKQEICQALDEMLAVL